MTASDCGGFAPASNGVKPFLVEQQHVDGQSDSSFADEQGIADYII